MAAGTDDLHNFDPIFECTLQCGPRSEQVPQPKIPRKGLASSLDGERQGYPVPIRRKRAQFGKREAAGVAARNRPQNSVLG